MNTNQSDFWYLTIFGYKYATKTSVASKSVQRLPNKVTKFCITVPIRAKTTIFALSSLSYLEG